MRKKEVIKYKMEFINLRHFSNYGMELHNWAENGLSRRARVAYENGKED